MITKPEIAGARGASTFIVAACVAMCASLFGCGGGGGGGNTDAGTDADTTLDATSDGTTEGGADADAADGTGHNVGGTSSGTRATLVLTLSIGGDLAETINVTDEGGFGFSVLVPEGASYTVAVSPATTTQTCGVVAGASGVMGTADVEDIEIECVRSTDFSSLVSTGCEGQLPTITWSSVPFADAYVLEFEPVTSGAIVTVEETGTTLAMNPGLADGNWSVRVAARRGALTSPFSGTAPLSVLETPSSAPTVGPSIMACVGDDVAMSATGAQGDETYRWLGPNGFMAIDDQFNLPIVDASRFGDYDVALVLGGCAGPTATVTVEEGSCP